MIDKNCDVYKIALNEINIPLREFRLTEMSYREATGFKQLPEFLEKRVPINDQANFENQYSQSVPEIQTKTLNNNSNKNMSENGQNHSFSQNTQLNSVQISGENFEISDKNLKNESILEKKATENKAKIINNTQTISDQSSESCEKINKNPKKINPIFSYHPYIEAVKLLSTTVLPESVFQLSNLNDKLEPNEQNIEKTTHINDGGIEELTNTVSLLEENNLVHLKKSENLLIEKDKANTHKNTKESIVLNNEYDQQKNYFDKGRKSIDYQNNMNEKSKLSSHEIFDNDLTVQMMQKETDNTPLFDWPLLIKAKRENIGNHIPFRVSEEEGRKYGVNIDGYRQTGGPVNAGGTYVVGEDGPEILSMGNTGGTIIPNMSRGSTTNNKSFVVNIENVNISTTKPRSKEDVIQEVKGALEELAKSDFRAETGLL